MSCYCDDCLSKLTRKEYEKFLRGEEFTPLWVKIGIAFSCLLMCFMLSLCIIK